MATGTTLDFNFKIDGSANSLLVLPTGSISNGGASALDLYQAGTTTPFDVNGVYNLIHFGGGFVNPNPSIADPVAGANYAFSNSGTDLILTITGGLTSAVWAIDNNGSWTSPTSWTGGIPNTVSAIATFGSVITAPRTVTLDGDKTVGVIQFTNANSYSLNPGSGGNITLDNGSSNASITDSLGTHSINVPLILNSNTTLTVTNAADTMTISGNIGGAGGLTTTGSGNVTLGGNNSFAGVLNASGSGNLALSGINSFGGLTSSGTGTVIVTGANTYTGPTTITTGKIQMGPGGTLGGGLSALSIATGATLDLNGQNATVGSLSGAGTIDDVAGAGTSTLTTGGLSATVTFSGIIKNTTGNVTLTKIGTGSLTLSGGTSTYAGGTTLSSGNLFVTNTAGSATGTGNVTLNGGTFGGTGIITGSLIAGTAAHTINPGSAVANSIGTLKIGGLTTNPNTTLAFDLASPAGTSDLLAVTGNVILNGGNLVVNSLTSTGSTSLGYYKVLSYSGTLTGSTSTVVLPTSATPNIVYTLDTIHDNGFIDIHRGFMGDANDNGTVDVADLQIVLNNLGVTTSSWNLGNFDGAPTIDLNDLDAVLNNLGVSIPAGANVVAFAESLVAGTTATPEPTSLGILALGAGALLTRRRKASTL